MSSARTTIAACLLALPGAACASAQSQPETGTPARPGGPEAAGVEVRSDGVAVPAADAAARAVLERAARFQRGETPRSAPRTLHGSFYVGLRGEDGSMIKATVERWFTVDRGRMRTTRTEEVTGSVSSVGYDGQCAWFRDHASGDTVVYTDDPGTFDEDLAQLHEQIRLTRLLLDACVLDALVPRLVDPRVAGTRTVEDLDGDTHDVQLVTAQLEDRLFGPAPGAPPPEPGDPAPMLALELGVDARTGALWTLTVAAPHRPDLAPLELRFDFFGRSSDGLAVPGNIRVFRAGETRERMTLGVDVREDEEGEERLVLEVDTVLDDALFAVPR